MSNKLRELSVIELLTAIGKTRSECDAFSLQIPKLPEESVFFFLSLVFAARAFLLWRGDLGSD
jgi:hypothetical protein